MSLVQSMFPLHSIPATATTNCNFSCNLTSLTTFQIAFINLAPQVFTFDPKPSHLRTKILHYCGDSFKSRWVYQCWATGRLQIGGGEEPRHPQKDHRSHKPGTLRANYNSTHSTLHFAEFHNTKLLPQNPNSIPGLFGSQIRQAISLAPVSLILPRPNSSHSCNLRKHRHRQI